MRYDDEYFLESSQAVKPFLSHDSGRYQVVDYLFWNACDVGGSGHDPALPSTQGELSVAYEQT